MIDYKQLLTDYMAHVIDCESISFLDSFAASKCLSDEQLKQLKKIEKQARIKHPTI